MSVIRIAEQKQTKKHKIRKSSHRLTLENREKHWCTESRPISTVCCFCYIDFCAVRVFVFRNFQTTSLTDEITSLRGERARNNVCTNYFLLVCFGILFWKKRNVLLAAAQPLTQTTTHQLNSVWFLYDDFNFDIACSVYTFIRCSDVVVVVVGIAVLIGIVVVVACSALYVSFIALMLCGDLGSGRSFSLCSSSRSCPSLARHSSNCVS